MDRISVALGRKIFVKAHEAIFGKDVCPSLRLKPWTFVDHDGRRHHFRKRPWRYLFTRHLWGLVVFAACPAASQTTYKTGDITKVEVVNSTSSSVVIRTTGPISVNALDLDIRNLVFATDKVDVAGSTVVIRSTGPISVNALDLDIRNLTFAQDKVDATGSGVFLRNSAATELYSDTIKVQQTGLATPTFLYTPSLLYGLDAGSGDTSTWNAVVSDDTGLHVSIQNTPSVNAAVTSIVSSTFGFRNADFANFSNYALEGKRCLATCSVTYSGRAKSWLFSVIGGSATFQVNSSSDVVALSGDIWQDEFTPRATTALLNLSFIQSGATAQLQISGAR